MSSNDQDLGIGTASSEGEYYSQLLVNIPWAIPSLGYGVPTIFLFFIKASSTLLKSKTFVYVFPYFLIFRTYAGTLYIAYYRHKNLHTIISFF